ncbi:NUDIX hydrolase domain-like protein [Xylaria sp. FL1042]|nr:NUDIX hydrolase domain-like protein [Xylaria sp. FL1042]
MADRSISNFEHDPSVAEFAFSKRSYLESHPGVSFGYIATSSLVVDTTDKHNPRVLLIQRAAHDEDPNKWEPPGGACDDDDVTILHAAARELWEEAGLQAARIGGPVGDPYFFTLDDGKQVCQFNYAVHAKTNNGTPLAVKLDPNEHQCFVWATEDEVKAKKVGNIVLDFTREEVERTVLLSFQHFKET